jgi:hypothetical protein
MDGPGRRAADFSPSTPGARLPARERTQRQVEVAMHGVDLRRVGRGRRARAWRGLAAALVLAGSGWLSGLGPLAPAAAKDYAIRAVDIDARLSTDGSLQVTETRTYVFEDAYRYAYRTLPVDDRVRYTEITVSEGDRPYREAGGDEPGTFRLVRRGSALEVRWNFRARDEARAFTVGYRVTNLVQRYADAAVCYYKFIGEEWDRSSATVQVRLAPPAPIDAASVRQWLHGPLWASSLTEPDGTLRAQCERLPAHAALEIRALYPPQLFAQTPALLGPVAEQVAAEEARWAEAANRARAVAQRESARRAERAALALKLAIGLAAAGLLGWFWLYQRFGRREEGIATPAFARPATRAATAVVGGGTLPPALVDYLLHNREVSGNALVATMMDLARRGFVVMREAPAQARGLFGGTRTVTEYSWVLQRAHFDAQAGELLDYEAALLRFVFDELAGGADEITLKTLQRRRREFTRFFTRWRRDVSAVARERQLYDPESLRGLRYSIGIAIALFVLGLAAVALLNPIALIAVAAGVLVLLLSFTIPRRTPQGEQEARAWRSLRDVLKQQRAAGAGDREWLSRVDAYLVYALVLGLGEKRLRALAATIPPGEAATIVPWYVGHGSQGFSPAGFAGGFSAMATTAASAMSSAAGAGGGASGGGGGGAGGGGGGAG